MDEPVTMDDLEALDTVKADTLYDVLQDAGIPHQQKEWVLNKLIELKMEAEAIRYQAEYLWMNKDAFIGRTIWLPQIRDEEQPVGVLSDIWRVVGANRIERVFLVLNGKIHAVPNKTMVRVGGPEVEQCKAYHPASDRHCSLVKHHELPHDYYL